MARRKEAPMVRRRTKEIDALIAQMNAVSIEEQPQQQDSENEGEVRKPFRFFDLPYELRLRVYELLLISPKTMDLDPANHRTVAPTLRIFYVCRRMHDEAAHVFYGRNTFRLFPIHGRYINAKYPLFARVPRKYRALITRLELRLGPGFTRPPKGWVVDSRLGLSAVTKAYRLKIFVEIDPASSEIFDGFRTGEKSFYTEYCVGLLRALLAQIPAVGEVELDAYPSVSKDSPLLKGLLEEAKLHQKKITWGPERGWDTIVEKDLVGILEKMGLGGIWS
ncbi:hypothetical protein C7974DRAFT_127503 [Boeremia exigua]|uniref:uncharacterized protein n=1 Tax=Boeremia exigua TaxID=749465 RepID=UPI001E8D4EDC|nr:uncharacterized protein C7974DRAFT_127503 [Boeremia exigua]KAH6639205.1 hypothetical protein C7974DRAFT_127503 [Boeremia exigua]